MPHSSFKCVGFSAIRCSVDVRPMWHSTQLTRACDDFRWLIDSSGCTEWHIVAQKRSLFVYSQPAMPSTPTTATPTSTSRIALTDPSIHVRRPILMFIRSTPILVARPIPRRQVTDARRGVSARCYRKPRPVRHPRLLPQRKK